MIEYISWCVSIVFSKESFPISASKVILEVLPIDIVVISTNFYSFTFTGFGVYIKATYDGVIITT